MKLKLYFSEEDMKDYLNRKGYSSMDIRTFEYGIGRPMSCQVEVWWREGALIDFKSMEDKSRSHFEQYSLETTFLREIKAQLLKL